jgi:hypothetical protein
MPLQFLGVMPHKVHAVAGSPFPGIKASHSEQESSMVRRGGFSACSSIRTLRVEGKAAFRRKRVKELTHASLR